MTITNEQGFLLSNYDNLEAIYKDCNAIYKKPSISDLSEEETKELAKKYGFKNDK